MLRLYDTAAGHPVELRPRKAGHFSFYVCGPTVYDLPHIGHGRAVLTWDFIRRYLEWTGLVVRHVANITDIDDKIIARARRETRPAGDIAREFEAEWWNAMDRLGALRPHEQPHATEYVEQMVDLIGALIDAGYAYDTPTTVYFTPESLPDYGLLARQSVDSLQAGARVEADPEKRTPIDFALWKKADGPEDLPQWPSPWGAGRPGWHTECVVMSLDLLGDDFDLHGGGLDLMFPHHENERAQAIALGHSFVRHWVHHGFVEMGGEKMSKSLGNFTSLTDLLNQHDPRAYRLLLLRAHYRAPVEVTPDLIAVATTSLERLDAVVRRLDGEPAGPIGRDAALQQLDADLVRRFSDALDDDLNTPAALAVVFEAVRQCNTAFDAGDGPTGRRVARTVVELCGALGLFLRVDEPLPPEIAAAIARLDAARAEKDWATADTARAELQAAGWTVEQTKAGTTVRR